MRMPAPNPNAFARCPDCGALVSARITNPTCPKSKRDPERVIPLSKLDRFMREATVGGMSIVIDPPNLPALARGGRIPLPIDDTPARRRSNRRIR